MLHEYCNGPSPDPHTALYLTQPTARTIGDTLNISGHFSWIISISLDPRWCQFIMGSIISFYRITELGWTWFPENKHFEWWSRAFFLAVTSQRKIYKICLAEFFNILIIFSVPRFSLPLPQRHSVRPTTSCLHQLVRGGLSRSAGGKKSRLINN